MHSLEIHLQYGMGFFHYRANFFYIKTTNLLFQYRLCFSIKSLKEKRFGGIGTYLKKGVKK